MLLIFVLLISLMIFRYYKTATFKGNQPVEIFNLKNDSLQFTIQSEYEEYLVNQDIWLKVKLYNNSKAPYLMNLPFSKPGIVFTIKEGDSLRLRFDNQNYEPARIFSCLLPESDSLVTYIHLIYNISDILKAGTFTVIADYQDLESNEITFAVSKPKGGDKVIFDELHGPYKHATREEQYNYRLEILEKYKDSQYCPQFYIALLQFTEGQKDTSLFQDMFDKYFDNYPNSFSLTRIMDEYWYYLGNVKGLSHDQARQKLRDLKDKYKGTLIEDCILTDNFKLIFRDYNFFPNE
ncbi:MAG: hypothetical protein IPM96_02625 [Ignavibacteria bacterium]|nr:hypothetical protein [Ignavibacteria bacterium]